MSVEVKNRKFSFLQDNINKFDQVLVNNVETPIPACIGSSYWAIIKCLLENFNEKVYYEDLLDRVQELMADRDEERWNKFISKKNATVFDRKTGKSELKEISNWQKRIISNTKTLMRIGGTAPYGLRLKERGFQIIHNTDTKKNYFMIVSI